VNIKSIVTGTYGEHARPGSGLVGRTAEQVRIDQMLLTASSGQQSAALVVRGDPGIGKTALLDHAVRQAAGYRVVRISGAEAEMELPYAALHLLCAPLGDCITQLPALQREALEAAIGLSPGPQADGFLVGLATLTLLSVAAQARPLLCVIDDAQWLDRQSAQALSFMARRLKAERIVFLLAERDSPQAGGFDGLQQSVLGPVSDAAARTLFASMIPGRVDEAVVARIIAETRGNPGALLDVVGGVSPARFAGGFGANLTDRLPRRLDAELSEQLVALPAESRQLLLVAAAEPIGDPTLLWRAAAHLGIPMTAAEPLEAAALLTLGSRVTFAQPVLRSAIYARASTEQRRAAHRAIASAIDATADRDRGVWHLARAADGPDETIATQLERCTDEAQQRGGLAAAAAFLEQAAVLTLDPGLRVDRAVTAAATKLDAGAPDAAAKLVTTAEMGPLDHLRWGRVQLLRARIEFASKRGSDAPPLLLNAARQLEQTDPEQAREAYLEALAAAIFAGRLGRGGSAIDIADTARARCPAGQFGRPIDLLLDGLVVRFAKSYEDAVEPLRRAVGAFRAGVHDERAIRWLWLACRIAPDLWDDKTWHTLTTQQLEQARRGGASGVLPYALMYRAIYDVHRGDFEAAGALIEEADATAAAMGNPRLFYTPLVLAAWRGHEDSAQALFTHARQDARERGEGIALTTASLSAAILYNGLGRYDEALAAATDAAAHDELGLCGWSLVEQIEAAARSGAADAGRRALTRLCARTRRSGSDWALGIEARSRALLSKREDAEDLYREAIDRLGRTRIATQLARTQLVYGEWLRREGRRFDARALLRQARDSFTAMGAEAFAERAHLELLASGETTRPRAVGAADRLTPQENRVALLARDGLTNPAIGERLFVSPRTVEYHLHKVFAKLGITSRNELHLALPRANGRAPLRPSGVDRRQIGQLDDASECA
jgi:DNA-binding CsgD family transcriptional regulator/tetratricopeptide (TPR) repeat protein